MKMSIISAAWAVIGSSVALAANLVVPHGTVNNFSGTLNAPDSALVAGQLNVNGGTFTPASLSINGLGSPNGDVNLNGGSIAPGSITVTSFSHLYVNTTASTLAVSNEATTIVSSAFTVQDAGSGLFDNEGSLYITTGGSLVTDGYVGSGGSSAIGGVGTLSATSFSHEGAIIPGDDDQNGAGVGTLTIESSLGVSLADTTYLVDFLDNGGSFSADQILVNGQVTLGGNSTLIVNPVFDPTHTLQLGDRFNIIDSNLPLVLGDSFANIDEPNYTIEDDNGLTGKYFQVGYDVPNGQVYLTVVPEPTTLAGLGLLGIRLLRRRKAR